MDFVIWIIVIVLIVGVVWWLLNRSNSTKKGSATPRRTDGGLSGGSAAASAEAAGTAGLPSAAGFGSAAEPTPPTTADDDLERSGAPGHQQPVGAPESIDERNAVGEKNAMAGQDAGALPEVRGTEPLGLRKSEHPAETATAAESHAAQEPLARQEPLAAQGPAASPEPTSPIEAMAREDASNGEGSAARQAEDEWETQWSEAGGPAHSAHSTSPGLAGAAATGTSATGAPATPLAEPTPGQGSVSETTESAHYVHHAEYTDPHAPTLPGAETAAADDLAGDLSGSLSDEGSAAEGQQSVRLDDATAARAASATGYEPASEPIGHLAAEHPYGAGSASPGPDGSGPADYVVKGDAGAMVYYEEGHPDYEQTTAEVWFESAAHAEAAGFRAPRRTRF